MNKWKRILNIISLCLLILFNSIPVNTYAEEIEPVADKQDDTISEEISDNSFSLEQNLLSGQEGFVKDGVLEDDGLEVGPVQTETIEEKNSDEINENVESAEELSPAFSQEVVVDDVLIIVTAPEGVFPEKSHLSVKKVVLEDRSYFQKMLNIGGSDDELRVEQEELDDIENAVVEERPHYNEVVSSYTFDITILDADLNEIQPNDKVSISFLAVKNDKRKLDTNVYHIEEEDGKLSASRLDVDVDEFDESVKVTVETNSFSYYQVEFTYSGLQYVLPSDTENEEEAKVLLSDVLNYLEIKSGNIDSYEVSSPELFSVEENEGELYLVAHQAFHTEEWLYLVIDGEEYTIVVTDEQGYWADFTDAGGIASLSSTSSWCSKSGYTITAGSMCGATSDSSQCYCGYSFTCKNGYSGSGNTGYLGRSSKTIHICDACACNSTSQYTSGGYDTQSYSISGGGGSCSASSASRSRWRAKYCSNSCDYDSSYTYYSWGAWDVSSISCDRDDDTGYVNITYHKNLNDGTLSSGIGGWRDSDRPSHRIWYSWENPGSYNPTAGGSYTAEWDDHHTDWSSVDLPTLTREGYIFKGWKDQNGYSYSAGQRITPTGNYDFYAQWEPRKYELTITNINDRVKIFGTVTGYDEGNPTFELEPGASNTWVVTFDNYWTVTTGNTDPTYYDSNVKTGQVYSPNAGSNISTGANGTSKTNTYRMGINGAVEIGADRKYKVMTFNVKNDNGHNVTGTITLSVIDNRIGTTLTDSKVLGDDFSSSSTKSKTFNVNANSSQTVTFNVPENVNVDITAVNDAGTSGVHNTADYLTIVETDSMYSSTLDKDRVSYREELGSDVVAFSRDNDYCLDQYKGLTELNSMTVDNQYMRASVGFTSDSSIITKVYECLTEACTTKWTVQPTQYDSSTNNYYANSISEAVEGESLLVGTSGDTTKNSYQWTNTLDRYKTYKIVQENLIRDRFYSWDSGYSISTTNYTGAGTGTGSIELNKKARAYKVDVFGVQHDPVFSGSTFDTGTGGSIVTGNMKQPLTEVTVRTVTGHQVPVADVEMYFGAETDVKSPNKNIYVSAPTTKAGIKFKSGSSSGKALQPDIDYTGFLGGSWVTDLSGDYIPFNGYLADDSWYKDVTLNMSHYQDVNELPTNFNLEIDTARLTLRAKQDIGNVNAVFDVLINNAQYTYGEDGSNGEMIRSVSTIVMHLGSDEYPACSDDMINQVCLASDGYYEYTLDVPTDKLLTVRHHDGNAEYYSVVQTCDVDTSKYACRSYVAENVNDNHVETFDFYRKSSTLNVSSELRNVVNARNIINDITIEFTDTQNNNPVCTVGDYCAVWKPEADWSDWSSLAAGRTEIDDKTIEFQLNPKTNNPDETDLIVPAGIHYEVSATATKNDSWVDLFLNGLYGDNAGYSTYVEVGATGVTQIGESGNVKVVVNDYQYGLVTITTNVPESVSIYDGDSNLVETKNFPADGGSYPFNIAHNNDPYTFTQAAAVAGYYWLYDPESPTADSKVLADVEQDGTYTIDMSLTPIVYEFSVVGNKGGVTTPITNITYAIGTDADHIIYSGIVDAATITVGAEAGMLPDTDYHIYFGGTVNGSGVQDYNAVVDFTTAHSAPAQNPHLTGTIDFKKANIQVSDIYGSYSPTVTLTFDKDWTFDDVSEGVYGVNTTTGADVDIWIPKDLDYVVFAEDIFGYSKNVDENDAHHVGEDTIDHIIVTYTAKTYVVEIEVENRIYPDVKLENVEYTVRCDDDDVIVGAIARRSDANGRLGFELTYGPSFYIKESENIYGYKEDKEAHNIPLPTGTFRFVEDDPVNYDTIDLLIDKDPLTYDVELTSNNSVFSTPLEGVEFTLIDAYTLEPVRIAVTNADGKIEFLDLPYGHDYVIQMSDVPFGYDIDIRPYDVVLPEAFGFNKVIKMQIDTVPKEFDVHFDVSNKEYPDIKVKDVEYTIYDYKDNSVVNGLTDNNGELTLHLVYHKDYYIKETGNVFGYAADTNQYNINLPETFTFTEPYEVEIQKTPLTYDVKILVDNDEFDTPLDDVEFTIYDAKDNTPIGTVKSEDGVVVFEDLPYGHDYYVEITDVPFGYIPDTTHYDVVVPGDYQFDEPITMDIDVVPKQFDIHIYTQNDFYPDVKVEGVGYTVYDYEDNPIADGHTDENGELVITLTYHKEYYVKETENVFGYREDTNQYDIVLPDDFDFEHDEFEININKKPLNLSVKVNVDNSFYDLPVDNVEFTIYDATDNTEIQVHKSVDGEVLFEDLPYGHELYIKVTDVPFGYKNDYNSYEVVVPGDYGFDKDILMDIDVTPYQFSIKTHTSNSVYPDVKIEGVGYSVIYDEDQTFTFKYSDANGEAEYIVTYGKDYCVIETQNVFGYEPDSSSYWVDLPEIFNFDSVDVFDIDIHKKPLSYSARVTTKNSVFGDLLDGVEYTIYDKDNGNKPIGTLKTENGVVVFPALDYGHNYTIKQTDTIFGYQPDDKFYDVIVPADYGFDKPIDLAIDAVPYKFVVDIEALNAIYNDVPVWGASYVIVDENGTLYSTMVTNDKGQASAELDYGRTYHIENRTLPFGYEKDEKQYPIVTPESFKFEVDHVKVDLRPDPIWYNIPLEAVDNNNHPVIDVEWTIWDNTIEHKTHEPVIAERAKENPITKSDENGKGNFYVPYGHDYYVTQIVPGGYVPNEDPIYPVRPTKEDEVDNPPIIKFVEEGQVIPVKVSSNVSTTFHLFKNGTVIKDMHGNGAFDIVYSQAEVSAYKVSADTPWGYTDLPDQGVKISVGEDKKAVAKDIYFGFSLATLEINVSNMVPGTKVNLYNKYTNELVETKSPDGYNDVTFTVPWSEYYVKVVWPSGYARNNKAYDVDISGLSHGHGYAIAPTIKPDRYTEGVIDGGTVEPEKKKVVFGLEISARNNGNLIADTKYNVYIRGTNTIAEDYSGNKLENVSDGRYYLKTNNNYDVKQVYVPDRYVIEEERKAVPYDSDTASDTPSTIYSFNQVMFNNDFTPEQQKREEKKEEIRDVCAEQRTKLINAFAKYNEADYSAETWAKMKSIYDEAMRELDTYCGTLEDDADQDKEIVYKFDTEFGKIDQLQEIEQDAKKSIFDKWGTHWWHWVILILSIIAIILNIILRKLGLNIGISLVVTVIDVLIMVFKDFCIYSIIFTVVHFLVELLMIIIRLIADKNDYEEEYEEEEEE